MFVSPSCQASGLQVNLQSFDGGIDNTKGHMTLSSSSGLPRIPKREPLEKSSTVRYLPSEEIMDPMIDLRNRRMERQPDRFEGTTEEHILRSLQAVGQLPYSPQEAATKNGHMDQDEWERYCQLQMLHKGDKNQLLASEIPSSNSALLNAAMTHSSVFPYPPANVMGMQKMSINESYDEGIEKDFPPMSKISRDMSARYPTVTTKLPSSSLQPSLADQGYNTAFGSNGQTTLPNSASATQMLQQQSQQGFGSAICADSVIPPPLGPPPIPPRALKPDYRVKGHALLPHEVFAHSSSSTSPQQTFDSNGTPIFSSSAKSYATGVPSTKFQESSVISSSSQLLPMPSPKFSNSGPILRRDHQHPVVGKSSSLKYNIGALNGGSTSSSLLQQSNRNRGARSMDLSGLEWQCHICTTKNLSSDKVCSVCSASRMKSSLTAGNEVPGRYGRLELAKNDLVQGMSKKACPACTLENEPDRTLCSLCECPLETPYTYV